MRTRGADAACPICKVCVSEERVIPIYGRGRNADLHAAGLRNADSLYACKYMPHGCMVPARPVAHPLPSRHSLHTLCEQHSLGPSGRMSSGSWVQVGNSLSSIIGAPLVHQSVQESVSGALSPEQARARQPKSMLPAEAL